MVVFEGEAKDQFPLLDADSSTHLIFLLLLYCSMFFFRTQKEEGLFSDLTLNNFSFQTGYSNSYP